MNGVSPIFWDEVSFKSGLVASLLIYSYCLDGRIYTLTAGRGLLLKSVNKTTGLSPSPFSSPFSCFQKHKDLRPCCELGICSSQPVTAQTYTLKNSGHSVTALVCDFCQKSCLHNWAYTSKQVLLIL